MVPNYYSDKPISNFIKKMNENISFGHVTYVLRETNVNENILKDGFMKNKESVK